MAQKDGFTLKNLTLVFSPKLWGGVFGQKANVNFFTVDPYLVGPGDPRTFLELGKIQKNIFLKIKCQQ